MKDHNTIRQHIPLADKSSNALFVIDRNIFFATGTLFFISFLPIATYRTITESWQLALLDWLVMLVSAIMLAYAWLSNQVRVASFIYIFFLSCAVIAGTLLIDPNLVLYAATVVLLGFYLLPLNRAILACGAPAGGLLLYLSMSKAPIFAPKLIIVFAILGIAFASRYARRQLEMLASLVKPDALFNSTIQKVSKGNGALQENFRDPEKSATTLLIFSFYNLGTLNDTYGHHTAERILTHAVTLLANKVRLQDRIFLSGLDTLLLLIESADSEDADKLGQKLCNTINSSTVVRDYKVTVSARVADLLDRDAITGWIKRGDQVLHTTDTNSKTTSSTATSVKPGIAS